MRDLFAAFLVEPSAATYRELAASLIASPGYAPHSTDLRDIAVLCQQERYQEALEKSDGCLWGRILSPRLHLYRSIALSKLGDEAAEKMEEAVFRACIDGIVSSGDGSVTAPFYVTGISDEYDVLQSLKQQSIGQRLVQVDDRAFDVHQLADGGEFWFDITDVKRQIDRHFAAAAP